ncbi:hypothetical protein Scep_025358 [Stephania cephalantha]|uniref:Uncharacterized protein n=1 Tax=Stephania cephalantha TaxID=152367 RepID=A0AAP0EIJ5_9MAGN
MEKTMFSCITTFLVFSLVLSTMPQGIISKEICIVSGKSCKVVADCPNCSDQGFPNYTASCLESNHMCGCCGEQN